MVLNFRRIFWKFENLKFVISKMTGTKNEVKLCDFVWG